MPADIPPQSRRTSSKSGTVTGQPWQMCACVSSTAATSRVKIVRVGGGATLGTFYWSAQRIDNPR